MSSLFYTEKAPLDLNLWFLANVAHIKCSKKGKLHKFLSHIPEVFWLKLMALDAHNDGLLPVDGFPINLRRKRVDQ